MSTGSAAEFTGGFTGVWTVGVPEVSVPAGHSFTWHYLYESESIDGDFEAGFNLQVFRED